MGTYEPDLSELSAAVRSIRMQTLSSWELLICDDGSAEETYRNIKKLAACDPRIRVSRNSKNRGLAYALNRCILHAGGEFIARMDADDISRPERFMKQVKFLRENPEYMWVSSAADLFEGKRVWGSAYRPEMPNARSFLHSSPYIHPAVMFRREVFFSSACPEEPPAGCSKCSGMPAGSSSAKSRLLGVRSFPECLRVLRLLSIRSFPECLRVLRLLNIRSVPECLRVLRLLSVRSFPEYLRVQGSMRGQILRRDSIMSPH